MPQSVKVTGGDEVARAFEALARDVADLSDTHRRVAELLIPGVGRRSPRNTGALAASWRAEATKIAAGVVSDRPYAGPVEYGARGIPGARMVADTIAEQTDAIVTEYATAIEKRGKRHGFGTD